MYKENAGVRQPMHDAFVDCYPPSYRDLIVNSTWNIAHGILYDLELKVVKTIETKLK